MSPDPMPPPEPAAPAPDLPAGWTLPDLRIGRDGEWYEGDVEITHAGILANLRATLRRDDRGHFIQTRVRIPVRVDDTPFIVERVEARAGGLHAWLNDGTDGPLDPETLRLGPGNVPYGIVKDGAFAARFSRAATFQLLALAEGDERTDETVLRLGDRSFTIPRAS
jgi:hypothetical protein